MPKSQRHVRRDSLTGDGKLRLGAETTMTLAEIVQRLQIGTKIHLSHHCEIEMARINDTKNRPPYPYRINAPRIPYSRPVF